MKKIFLILFAFALGTPFLRGQNDSLVMRFTLEDCLRYAFGNNNTKKQMELDKKTQELNYQLAKESRMPNLNASASGSFSNNNDGSRFSGTAGINTGMTIFQGGQINKTITKEKLGLEQSELKVTQYDDKLSVQILEAFLTLIGNEELIKYQSSVMESSREALKQGEQKYSVGSILESDYLLLKAQFASDTNNIVETQASIIDNLLSLKVLLSMDPDEEFAVIAPDTALLHTLEIFPTKDEALDEALAYSPDLRISQYDIDIAKKSLRIAKSSYYPTVSLNAGITANLNEFNNFGSQKDQTFSEQVGISMNIPIYSRGTTRTRVRQSAISLERSELAHEQNILATKQTIVKEYQDLVSAYNNYKVSEQTKNAYEMSFLAYKNQFQYGSITTVELLQQQNNYLNALNKFIQNKYSFILQRKILDVYMGKEVTF